LDKVSELLAPSDSDAQSRHSEVWRQCVAAGGCRIALRRNEARGLSQLGLGLIENYRHGVTSTTSYIVLEMEEIRENSEVEELRSHTSIGGL